MRHVPVNGQAIPPISGLLYFQAVLASLADHLEFLANDRAVGKNDP